MAQVSSDNKQQRPSRKRHILECLARELEGHPGEKITTAGLARAVGVTEAALYRHFPSKARMYEGLIEFIEDSVFGLITKILDEETDAIARCEKIMRMLLGFAERNPGMTRILAGDALVGENARLRTRTGQFFDRIETQFKQILREGEMRGEGTGNAVQISANLMLVVIEGKFHQFVRSEFSRSPLMNWDNQWALLRSSLA